MATYSYQLQLLTAATYNYLQLPPTYSCLELLTGSFLPTSTSTYDFRPLLITTQALSNTQPGVFHMLHSANTPVSPAHVVVVDDSDMLRAALDVPGKHDDPVPLVARHTAAAQDVVELLHAQRVASELVYGQGLAAWAYANKHYARDLGALYCDLTISFWSVSNADVDCFISQDPLPKQACPWAPFGAENICKLRDSVPYKSPCKY